MTPEEDITEEHFNPLLVTVLPPERRARHPYQLCVMFLCVGLGLWQLFFGPPPNASVNDLNTHTQGLLNGITVAAGLLGAVAAWVPERIVRVTFRAFGRRCRFLFDATYFRLFEEMGCHMLLLSVWVSYGVTIWAAMGLVKGMGFGIGAALCFGTAAIWRTVQIIATLKGAGVFSRQASAIIGVADFERRER